MEKTQKTTWIIVITTAIVAAIVIGVLVLNHKPATISNSQAGNATVTTTNGGNNVSYNPASQGGL